MQFKSLAPFVPSGKSMERSKELFLELGFEITYDGGDLIVFQKDACRFFLQKYDQKDFAENLMIDVRVDNVQELYESVVSRGLEQKYGIRITKPKQQFYGIEVNMIDIAGVCWHFIQ